MAESRKKAFYHLPKEPGEISAVNILLRLVEGIGFRYRWATEQITGEQAEYKPAPGCMSYKELLLHIFKLVHVVHAHFEGETSLPYPPEKSDIESLKNNTLDLLQNLGVRLAEINDTELTRFSTRGYSFWYMINGPLADALTHIGQINSWNRISGNPSLPVDVFRGIGPER
jgi:hypothetical protein